MSVGVGSNLIAPEFVLLTFVTWWLSFFRTSLRVFIFILPLSLFFVLPGGLFPLRSGGLTRANWNLSFANLSFHFIVFFLFFSSRYRSICGVYAVLRSVKQSTPGLLHLIYSWTHILDSYSVY